MNILIIFIAVTVVLLSLTVTALIITIKNLIKTKQAVKMLKQRETAYQHYNRQEIIIDERLNTEKNEIATGNINDLFNQHFNGVPNSFNKPKVADITPPCTPEDSND